jgi:hypothetical protein
VIASHFSTTVNSCVTTDVLVVSAGRWFGERPRAQQLPNGRRGDTKEQVGKLGVAQASVAANSDAATSLRSGASMDGMNGRSRTIAAYLGLVGHVGDIRTEWSGHPYTTQIRGRENLGAGLLGDLADQGLLQAFLPSG